MPNPHGDIYVCSACSWGFVYPAPGEEILAARYRELREQDYILDAPARIVSFDREMNAVAGLLGHPPTSLLDVGSSYGLLLGVAVSRGVHAVGLEPSADAVRHCREQGLEVREGGIEQIASDEEFDVVFLWDVLEHLNDPLAVLSTIRHHVRIGGIASIVVPQITSLTARVLGERWWSVMDLHLHYPSRCGLLAMLKRTDFEPAYVGTHPKTVTGAQIARWIGVPAVRHITEHLIPARVRLVVNPGDQLLIRARAV